MGKKYSFFNIHWKNVQKHTKFPRKMCATSVENSQINSNLLNSPVERFYKSTLHFVLVTALNALRNKLTRSIFLIVLENFVHQQRKQQTDCKTYDCCFAALFVAIFFNFALNVFVKFLNVLFCITQKICEATDSFFKPSYQFHLVSSLPTIVIRPSSIVATVNVNKTFGWIVANTIKAYFFCKL